MKKIIFVISIIMLINCNSHSQDLLSHKWKDRLILILSSSTDIKEYNDQINELKKDEEGLIKRRLKIYKITPTKYALGLKDSNFIDSDIHYKRFKETDSVFEIVLIGLDGGIKLRKTELLTTVELFSIIDGMPMRSREIMEMRKKD